MDFDGILKEDWKRYLNVNEGRKSLSDMCKNGENSIYGFYVWKSYKLLLNHSNELNEILEEG